VSEATRLLFLAFPAGLVGFAAAPCCGILAPVYVPYALGATAPDVGGSRAASRESEPLQGGNPLRSAGMFVLGFAAFFTALGATASAFGSFLIDRLDVLLKVAGIYVILLGASTLLSLPVRLPGTKRCVSPTRVRSSGSAGLMLGFSFATLWTPCAGPTLGSILAMAATSKEVWQGSTLLFVYALGLAMPFLLTTLAVVKARRTLGLLQRHSVAIERISGAVLILVGVSILTGGWQGFLDPLTNWLSSNGWPPI